MAAVEIPRPLPGHVTLTMDEGVPSRAKGVQDLGEEELGIYEDNAECADLTDSELEDFDCPQSLNTKLGGLSAMAEGITVIEEEDEPASNDETDQLEGDEDIRLKPGEKSLSQPVWEQMEIKSSLSKDSVETKLILPPDLHDNHMETNSLVSSECPGVRVSLPAAPPTETIASLERTLVSFSNENIELDVRPGTGSTAELANSAALRGKANTPVSYLTEFPGTTDSRVLESRDASASHVTGAESREAMYKQAMNLMSVRCVSKQMEDSPWMNPFGIPDPEYFYVEQKKPIPMPPLKAWRGYNGNVYFEPIKVSPVKGGSTSQDSDIIDRPQSQSRHTYPQSRGAVRSRVQPSPHRSSSLPTYPVKVSTSINESGMRQMSVLDKRFVLNRFNPTIQEDLLWIEGQENTGTLAINSRKKNGQNKIEEMKPPRERLCKGLVSHKHSTFKKKRLPQLGVSGDKFIPPPTMSPLLRTLTQYSLSTARVTNNSPEHGYEKLPPLEHIKATLRSINNSHEDPYKKPGSQSRHSSLREEYRPLVKYSPDVKAKYEKHRGKMT